MISKGRNVVSPLWLSAAAGCSAFAPLPALAYALTRAPGGKSCTVGPAGLFLSQKTVEILFVYGYNGKKTYQEDEPCKSIPSPNLTRTGRC